MIVCFEAERGSTGPWAGREVPLVAAFTARDAAQCAWAWATAAVRDRVASGIAVPVSTVCRPLHHHAPEVFIHSPTLLRAVLHALR